jgi:hypothetical protein
MTKLFEKHTVWVSVEHVMTEVTYDDNKVKNIDNFKKLILKACRKALSGQNATSIGVHHKGVLLDPKQSIPQISNEEFLEILQSEFYTFFLLSTNDFLVRFLNISFSKYFPTSYNIAHFCSQLVSLEKSSSRCQVKV